MSRLNKSFKVLLGLYIFLLGFYLCNIVPNISFGDSPEIITTSYLLGICHPPGYLVYILFSKFFSYLPVSNVAYRYNLLSAYIGVLSILLCFNIFSLLVKNKYLSLLGCIMFAMSSSIYFATTSAEVYTFNLLLFLSLTYLLLKNLLYNLNSKEIYFTFFLFGLFLSQTPFALTYLPFFIYLFLQLQDKKAIKIIPAIFIFVLGFLLYLYLPLKISLQNYEFIRFDKFFPDYILAKGYQEISIDLERQINTISNLIFNFLNYFNIGIVFIIGGIIFLFRKAPRLFSAFSILLIFNLFFSLPASFSFDIYQFLYPTYFALVIFLLFGAEYLLSKNIKYIWVVVLFLFLFSITTYQQIININQRQRNSNVYNYAKEIVSSAGKNSIIIVSNSSTLFSFSLLYLKYVERSLNTPVIYQMFVSSPAYLNYIKQKYGDITLPSLEIKDVLPDDFFNFYYSKYPSLLLLDKASQGGVTKGILNHYKCLKITEEIILKNQNHKNIYFLNLEIYETPSLHIREKFYLQPEGNVFKLTCVSPSNYKKLKLKQDVGDYLKSLLLYERAKYYNLTGGNLKKYTRLDLITAQELNNEIPSSFVYFRGISDRAMEEYLKHK